MFYIDTLMISDHLFHGEFRVDKFHQYRCEYVAYTNAILKHEYMNKFIVWRYYGQD